jgi:hypothetical protein
MRSQEVAPGLRIALRRRGKPALTKMLRTELAEMAMPSFRSSLAIRT